MNPLLFKGRLKYISMEYTRCFAPSDFIRVAVKIKDEFVEGNVVSIPSQKCKNYQIELDNGKIINFDKWGEFYKKVV